MSKYHINKKGVPAICKAKNGKCPLGNEAQHFNSQEEAQINADRQNEKEHSLLPNATSIPSESENEFVEKTNSELYDKAIVLSDSYADEGSPDIPYGAETNPIAFANEYFDDKIKAHSGEEVDLKKYDSKDWADEIEENKEDMFSSNQYGGSAGNWSSSSEEVYNDSLRAAEETNAFYEGRRETVNEIFESVKSVDWTKGGVSQKQGELDALRELRRQDVLDI